MSTSDKAPSSSYNSNLDRMTSSVHISARRRSSVTASQLLETLPGNDRKGTSTLHILKIPPSSDTDNEVSSHAKHNDDTLTTSTSGSRRRISFAGSSFGPLLSPEVRHNQPLHSRRSSVASRTTHENKLTPIQVCELAERCKHPVSPAAVTVSETTVNAATPPSIFISLPESHQLPLIDRPNEVKELLEKRDNRKLFLLLAQAFPPETSLTAPLGDDPASWSYSQLEKWLTTTTREEADDATWVRVAGTCISSHSELIWEKVKELLGVPYGLEIDDEGLDERVEEKSSASEHDEELEEVWMEPIVATPNTSPSPRISDHADHRTTSLIDQSVSRMDDILEDVLPTEGKASTSSAVQGLSVGNCSSSLSTSFMVHEQPARRRRHTSCMFPSNFSHLAPAPTIPDRVKSLRRLSNL